MYQMAHVEHFHQGSETIVSDVGIDGGTYCSDKSVEVGSRDIWFAVKEGDGGGIPGATGQAARVEVGLVKRVEDLFKEFVR